MIRAAIKNDIPMIRDIYNHYVRESIATFDTEEKSLKQMEEKWSQLKDDFPYFVYEEKSEILGYAYASPWKPDLAITGGYNSLCDSFYDAKCKCQGTDFLHTGSGP